MRTPTTLLGPARLPGPDGRISAGRNVLTRQGGRRDTECVILIHDNCETCTSVVSRDGAIASVTARVPQYGRKHGRLADSVVV
jgi:hypothetical protein